ncbi:Diaminopimelate epimerase [Balamuthia mandrillaris]
MSSGDRTSRPPQAFEKWHGNGNDFILVYSHPHEMEATVEALRRRGIARLCDRRGKGVGADGVVVIALEDTVLYDARQPLLVPVVILNSDGSLAANCGNAMRCIASSVRRRLLSCPRSSSVALSSCVEELSLIIRTWAIDVSCLVRASLVSEEQAEEVAAVVVVEVGMGVPCVGAANPWHDYVNQHLHSLLPLIHRNSDGDRQQTTTTKMKMNNVAWTATVNIGNNHIVLGIEEEELDERWCLLLGSGLQRPISSSYSNEQGKITSTKETSHEATPSDIDGINVHLVRAAIPTEEQKTEMEATIGRQLEMVWKTWIWERGVGPTQACGTGACAVATSVRSGRRQNKKEKEEEQEEWTAVEMPGGLLFVRHEGRSGAVFLVGTATHVFSGTLH